MGVQAEALRRFIGKPAKDIYGRYIGYVVGITLDADGRLHSIGVDRGGGLFEEFLRSQIVVEGDNLLLIPSWKIRAENFRREYSLTNSRFQALDELLKNKEIPEHVYEELYKEYKDSMVKLEETQKELAEKLTRKISEIDNHIKHLEKFLGHLKVQHKTGEINDETYKTASDYLLSGIKKALQEREDIKKSLEYVTMPEQQQFSSSTSTTTTTDLTSHEEINRPIVVHLQDED